MVIRQTWTRQQLLVAFDLYCKLPFGKLDRRNPDVIRYAEGIGRSPSSLAMRLSNIASLDPEITSTGRVGLKGGASATVRSMWEEMNKDWERFVIESHNALKEAGLVDEPENENNEDNFYGAYQQLGMDKPVDATFRVGQSFFRSALLSAYDGKCCITGLGVPSLLVASHIVPWSHAPNYRVNPRNGLLLSVLHDRAFDAGLMTINENMTVSVSTAYPNDEFFSTFRVTYDGKPLRLPEKFRPAPEFLAYHRHTVFQG